LSDHSSPGSDSPVDKQPGKGGSSKPGISKPKKPKFGGILKHDLESFEHSSQSSTSSQPICASPQLVPSMGGGKKSSGNLAASNAKKPKFDVTPAYSSPSNSEYSGSQSSTNLSPKNGKGDSGKGVASKKPKKPGSSKLSDLARELGDMMRETEKEGLEVGEVKIPVVSVKKFVPIFSKKV